MPQVQKGEKKYTYKDYLSWPDEERWELIEGQPYNMTPAPSVKHQKIVARLYSRLEIALEGKGCVPFISPTDVVLSDENVIQPDVFVVCDEKKITEANIQGTPDLIFEVASPETARKDRLEKKSIYQKFGVSEYIIIDPHGQYLERFVLEPDGNFSKGEVLGSQEVLNLHSLEGVKVPLWEVFEVEKPDE